MLRRPLLLTASHFTQHAVFCEGPNSLAKLFKGAVCWTLNAHLINI